MSDLISRQDAIDAINKLEYPSSLVDVKRIIVKLPSAQPVRHGKWIEDGRVLVCSCCGKAYTLAETNYCWQCGAKMEVDDETD